MYHEIRHMLHAMRDTQYAIRDTTYQTKPTKDYVRNYQLFLQNKPNSPNVQIDVNSFIRMTYTIFISLTKVKNKPNSNPIQTQFAKS